MATEWVELGFCGHYILAGPLRVESDKILYVFQRVESTDDPFTDRVTLETLSSSDQARTWDEGNVIEEWFIGTGPSHPKPIPSGLYITPGGTIYLYATWLGHDDLYYISTDNGVTFSTWPATLAGLCLNPYVEIDTGGYLRYSGDEVYYSSDGETTSYLSTPLSGTDIRGMVLLSDGTVVVTLDENVGEIASAKSTDDGSTWTLGGTLSGTIVRMGEAVLTHHDIIVAQAYAPYGFTHAWGARSLDAGDTWEFSRIRRYNHRAYDIALLPHGYTAMSIYSTGEIFLSLNGGSWVEDSTLGGTEVTLFGSGYEGEFLAVLADINWYVTDDYVVPPDLPAIVPPPEITTEAEGFGYTAWVSWVHSAEGRSNIILRFAKKPAGEWITVEVDDVSADEYGYWYSYAQNYGNTFLVTCSKWRQESCYVYKSTDRGDTWAELTNNLTSGIRWLDCWNGSWVAILENGDVAHTTNGQTWTVFADPLDGNISYSLGEMAASQACLGEDGVIHIISESNYGIYYSKSEDLGETWTEAVFLLEPDDYSYLGSIDAIYTGGIGAYDGRVCIGAAFATYESWDDTSAFAVALVSSDNGDSWDTFLSQEVPLPPYYDQFYLNYASGFWMDSAKACIVISGHLYGEGDTPYPYDEAGGRYCSYACHVILDPALGGPCIENNNFLTAIEGTPDGIVTGTMCYGQEKGMGGQFCHFVPVKSYPEPCSTASPCREELYDSHAYFRELRAFFLNDAGEYVHETVWTGDYPGPHLQFPYEGETWDDNNYDTYLDVSLRFSPWRSGGAAGYSFWF